MGTDLNLQHVFDKVIYVFERNCMQEFVGVRGKGIVLGEQDLEYRLDEEQCTCKHTKPLVYVSLKL